MPRNDGVSFRALFADLPSQRPPDLPWALAGERATNSVPIWIPVALPPPILPRLVLWAGFERDVCARCELHRPNCQGYQTIDMSVEQPTKFGLSIGRPLRPSASSCRLPFNCAQLRSSSDGWMAPLRMEACARASVRSPAGLEWRHRQFHPKAVDRGTLLAGHEPSTSTKILPSLTSYFARSSASASESTLMAACG